ncbi:MAG: LysM peptidoglycan-binding domain-containing protein, partial [Parvularculaceae bacterium]|nr:LysM peptidoglycan-binding domain-containing protein [Parvularculaceae bacterium]
LCDVSLTALLDANPDIQNPRHVAPGRMLRVPGMPDSERQAIVVAYLSGVAPAHAGQPGIPTTLYVSQAGDSLERISAVHLVSEARVATLNPGVDWDRLKPGVEIRLPAQGAVVAAPAGVHGGSKAAAKPTRRAADADSLVSDGSSEIRTQERVISDEVTKVIPYRLKPVRGPADPGFDDSANDLGVDRTFVKPGSDVTLSATGLPANARVTISRGGNRNDLKEVDQATTGPDGSLKARVRVPEGADAGGVVFKATVDENGQTVYSDRVGVETVKK